MIRTSQHKLIWHVGKRTELYDLVDDPGETRDVAESRVDVRDALLLELKDWAPVPLTHTEEPFEAVDPKALEHLRGLGYVE